MDAQTDLAPSTIRCHRRCRDLPAAATRPTFRIRRESDKSQELLIVEDEYLIAADLEAQIRNDGGRRPRIALSLAAAEDELDTAGDIGGVILDISVGGTTSFGLADALVDAALPFVFFTGYSSTSIPDRFLGVPRISKPSNWREIKKALASARERLRDSGHGSFRDSVEAALPVLRTHARKWVGNAEAADDLVERTLERAISRVGNRSLRITIEEWLLSLLETTKADRDTRHLH